MRALARRTAASSTRPLLRTRAGASSTAGADAASRVAPQRIVPGANAAAATAAAARPGDGGLGSGLILNRVLLISKQSRFDYERRRVPGESAYELEQRLLRRGSDYNGLKLRHEVHERNQQRLIDALTDVGATVSVLRVGVDDALLAALAAAPLSPPPPPPPPASSAPLPQSDMRLASDEAPAAEPEDRIDAVFSVGGDATLLRAAQCIQTPALPLIGINSDPERSRGYLCVPSDVCDYVAIVQRLVRGQFHWLPRRRVVVRLFDEEPSGMVSSRAPIRALNEVFLAETDQSRYASDASAHRRRRPSGTPRSARHANTACFPSHARTSSGPFTMN